jgi:hypothetical protein
MSGIAVAAQRERQRAATCRTAKRRAVGVTGIAAVGTSVRVGNDTLRHDPLDCTLGVLKPALPAPP